VTPAPSGPAENMAQRIFRRGNLQKGRRAKSVLGILRLNGHRVQVQPRPPTAEVIYARRRPPSSGSMRRWRSSVSQKKIRRGLRLRGSPFFWSGSVDEARDFVGGVVLGGITRPSRDAVDLDFGAGLWRGLGSGRLVRSRDAVWQVVFVGANPGPSPMLMILSRRLVGASRRLRTR